MAIIKGYGGAIIQQKSQSGMTKVMLLSRLP
jgi:hypothetical protein